MIKADSETYSIWQIFIGVLSLGTCVNYAYFAAFAFPFEFESMSDLFTNFHAKPKDNFMILFWFFVEIIYIIDIMLHFLKEYRSDTNFTIVRDLDLIAKRYVRGGLIPDLLATLPFNVFFYLFDGQAREQS